MRTRSGQSIVRTTALVVVGAVALAAAGCGSTKKTSTPTSTTSVAKESKGTVVHYYWPMTGLNADNAETSRPPLTVKMDNTVSSRPQVGLKKADFVTEELVEGGLTRLAVFYDSHIPAVVGPVRSMRATDVGVVKPVDGIVVASGAALPTYAVLKQHKVKFYTQDVASIASRYYYRDSARHAPYNLFMKLGELAKKVPSPPQAPQAYFDWGKESDFVGVQDATSITARFSGGHATQFAYQGGKYVNTNSNAAPGTQFTPNTVLVVRVREGRMNYLDPAGNPVPRTLFVGSGKALIFHGGKVLRATWHKSGPTGRIKLTTQAGTVKMPRGHVWMEMVPQNDAGGQVTFQ